MAWNSRRPRCSRAIGRCSASIPAWPPRAAIPCNSIRALLPSRSNNTSTTRRATPCWRTVIPKAPNVSSRAPSKGWRRGGANMNTWLRCPGPTMETGKGAKMIDLKTKYLGLQLRNPLVVSASPLTEDLDNLKRMEEAGAAAVVMHSLFEEQITLESQELDCHLSQGAESYAESLSYFPELQGYNLGPEGYLEHRSEERRVGKECRSRW